MACDTAFTPQEDTRAYRTALGRFTTGIAVVTALTKDGPIGITVNSFASVSLDPALVLWSPDKKSSRHDPFVEADAFVIHILSADQRKISEGFVRSRSAFEDLDVVVNEVGVPVIQNCLAVFECKKAAAHDAGDHTILVGEVYRACEKEGEALLYASGAYRSLPAAA